MLPEMLNRFRPLATRGALPPWILVAASIGLEVMDTISRVNTLLWIAEKFPKIREIGLAGFVPYIPLLMLICGLLWLAILALSPGAISSGAILNRPQIVMEFENNEDSIRDRPPAVVILWNCGACDALEVHVETMFLDAGQVRFPIIPRLAKGERTRIQPEIVTRREDVEDLRKALHYQRFNIRREEPQWIAVACVITYLDEAQRRFITKAEIKQEWGGTLLANHTFE
jgi:hypothetical protein